MWGVPTSCCLTAWEILIFGLLDDLLQLFFLVLAKLLQSQLLRVKLLLPVVDLEGFAALYFRWKLDRFLIIFNF